MTDDTDKQPDPPAAPHDSALGKLDAFMAASPWHPRLLPFFVYIIFGLFIAGLAIEASPFTRPIVYAFVVGTVVFLLWRYRRLTPELTIRFHWLAVPTGIGLLFAWVYLGYWTNQAAAALQGTPVLGPAADFFIGADNALHAADTARRETHAIQRGYTAYGPVWYWVTMVLRLLGMALVVPMFEELFVRSAVLRATFSRSKTWRGILQFASDLPVIGDAVANSRAGRAAEQAPPAFTEQLTQTQVGRISMFSIMASTVVFMLSHVPRDWAGCIACGVVWCGLVWWTNRPRKSKGETWESLPPGGRTGLGPIAWSHGITNAALWYWTLRVGDWQFL